MRSIPRRRSFSAGLYADACHRAERPAATEKGRPGRAEEGQVNFDFDKYDIRPGDAKVLEANATWLKGNAKNLVLIEGHCDERGTPEYNLALGERRAKSAMSYLVAQGVQARRISIVSYGEGRLLVQGARRSLLGQEPTRALPHQGGVGAARRSWRDRAGVSV